jgi:hypothetical protein
MGHQPGWFWAFRGVAVKARVAIPAPARAAIARETSFMVMGKPSLGWLNLTDGNPPTI